MHIRDYLSKLERDLDDQINVVAALLCARRIGLTHDHIDIVVHPAIEKVDQFAAVVEELESAGVDVAGVDVVAGGRAEEASERAEPDSPHVSPTASPPVETELRIPLTIGARINDLRGSITMAEVAERAGICDATLYGIAKGRNVPRPKTLAKIANALGTTVAYLKHGNTQSLLDREQEQLESEQDYLYRLRNRDQ